MHTQKKQDKPEGEGYGSSSCESLDVEDGGGPWNVRSVDKLQCVQEEL